MSNEKFTQLPTTANATMSDIICAVQGYVSPSVLGISTQETLQQVYDLFINNTILFNAGNPNGVVSGTTYQLLWDITDNILYICTTTGSTSSAVWTPCIGQLTNGQLRIGSTGAVPIAATLTGGTNISITNSAGAITIAATESGGFTWQHITTSSITMVSFNGYIVDDGSAVTLALPTTSAYGDNITIVGKGAGLWSISQAASQFVIAGGVTSTPGVGGSVTATAVSDSITLICTTPNLGWTDTAISGNLVVV